MIIKEPFLLELPELPPTAPSTAEIYQVLEQQIRLDEQYLAWVKEQAAKIAPLQRLLEHLCATRNYYIKQREAAESSEGAAND
jgi:hypothetical protein